MCVCVNGVLSLLKTQVMTVEDETRGVGGSCRVEACVPSTSCVCVYVVRVSAGASEAVIHSQGFVWEHVLGCDALQAFRSPPVVCCNREEDIPPWNFFFFQGFLGTETRRSGASAALVENRQDE